jgi:hypothetical protein
VNRLDSAAPLVGFALPAAELLPGFLIPIFEHRQQLIVQVASGERVSSFETLSAADSAISLATIRQLGKEVVLIEGSTAIGRTLVHAFFDSQRVYVGGRASLTAVLNTILPQLVIQLPEYPRCLATLHDFLGKPGPANELRSGAGGRRYETASQIVAALSGRRTQSDDYINDARRFATVANQKQQIFERTAKKPLHE